MKDFSEDVERERLMIGNARPSWERIKYSVNLRTINMDAMHCFNVNFVNMFMLMTLLLILVIVFFGLRLMKDCYCKKPYLEWFVYKT
jgi:hypothetical protein